MADLDGSLDDAVDKAARRHGSEVQTGRAEFLGAEKQGGTDREQRDDARRIYREIVERSPVQRKPINLGTGSSSVGKALDPDNDSFVQDLRDASDTPLDPPGAHRKCTASRPGLLRPT